MRWFELNITNLNSRSIVAVSDTGMLRRQDGEIIESQMYFKAHSRVYHNGKRVRVHRLIAEVFLPKTEEDIALNRNCVDHITHNPVGMNINDVRNLRWCTKKENVNFDEARHNQSICKLGSNNPMFGKSVSEEVRNRIAIATKTRWNSEWGVKERQRRLCEKGKA